MSSEKVSSADGTSIAFERAGEGPSLVLVGGAFCDRRARASGTPLAALLAHRFTVFSYDRRGRGDSGDTPPYAVEREVDDLAAVVEAAGGSAFVFGNSSGALLAVDGASRGLPIPKLALFEPPLLLDAERLRVFANAAEQLAEHAARGRRAEAAELFLSLIRMPAPALEQLRKSPAWAGLEALAHTLHYDARITAGGPALVEQAARVRAATLAMDGAASPPWMREAVGKLASAIPGARYQTLEGQTHAVDIQVLARELEGFFAG